MGTPGLISTFCKSPFFALTTRLPIVSPMVIAPIFVDLAEGMSRKGRVALRHLLPCTGMEIIWEGVRDLLVELPAFTG